LDQVKNGSVEYVTAHLNQTDLNPEGLEYATL